MKREIIIAAVGGIVSTVVVGVVGLIWVSGSNWISSSLDEYQRDVTEKTITRIKADDVIEDIVKKNLPPPPQEIWANEVPITHLKDVQPACDSHEKMATVACLSAMHRYCNSRGHGRVGIGQEHRDGIILVACLP